MVDRGGLITAGPLSLFAKFNKKRPKDQEEKPEGVVEELGELTLDLDDEELLQLKKDWETSFSGSAVKNRIHADGDTNERYWIGKQFPDTEFENGKRPLSDNILFEALETMIPLATQQNPEPVVLTDNSPEMKELGDKIRMGLVYLADYNNLKTKLKEGVRQWSLRYLGVWKVGWDDQEKEIVVKSLNPKDLILDPHARIEDGLYRGEFLGEKMTDSAKNLVIRFPLKKVEIEEECEGHMGSLITYTQWWTDEYLFYTMGKTVLSKAKNPHYNYPTNQPTVTETGEIIQQMIPGKNHFARPMIPYLFLTVFNLGDEPCDKTSLVGQGLVTQDNINKRLKQIDRNADNINGGVVVNSLVFNKDQAAQVAEAHRQGRTITVPGNITEAIQFPAMQALPATLFDTLNDMRERFMARFGAAGSTAQGTEQEETVRGKIIAGNNDSTRIGGGVSEYLEVAVSRIFNYFVQMMYVYYDQPHLISVIGPSNAQMQLQIESSELPADRKFNVKVQNGSLVPVDELSQFNRAMSEWEAGVSDPLTYFEQTKNPNPQQATERFMLYRTNPALYMQQIVGTQPQLPVQPLPVGGGGSESGAPPTSVGPAQQGITQPNPIQQQESQILGQVPIPK